MLASGRAAVFGGPVHGWTCTIAVGGAVGCMAGVNLGEEGACYEEKENGWLEFAHRADSKQMDGEQVVTDAGILGGKR